jgi:hypothetical protein
MKIKFTDSGSGRLILNTELEVSPRRDEMVVIDEVVYECRGVKHVLTPARGGQYTYAAEVQIKPV